MPTDPPERVTLWRAQQGFGFSGARPGPWRANKSEAVLDHPLIESRAFIDPEQEIPEHRQLRLALEDAEDRALIQRARAIAAEENHANTWRDLDDARLKLEAVREWKETYAMGPVAKRELDHILSDGSDKGSKRRRWWIEVGVRESRVNGPLTSGVEVVEALSDEREEK